MHPLFTYINGYTTISQEDFIEVLGHFIVKTIKKKETLSNAGEICKYMAFITTGTMRKYYIDEKGVESIIDLYVENWWAGDRESFVNSTPSIYYIEALEDCEVLLISRENTLKLRDECRAFNQLLLKLDEQNYIAAQKRITSTVSSVAEKRYTDFVEFYPHFIQRFPQHLIASYLGITKDTLSRIRKKMLNK